MSQGYDEFNFIHESLPESDKDLFFGPLTEQDKFIVFNDAWNMLDIMVVAGIFKSKSEARNNGYFVEIPIGFTDFTKGRRKTRITILNVNSNHEKESEDHV